MPTRQEARSHALLDHCGTHVVLDQSPDAKLTESLAAPLIEVTRKRFEAQLSRKEAEVAGREAAIRDQQAQIAAARDAIDVQVAAKVDEDRPGAGPSGRDLLSWRG